MSGELRAAFDMSDRVFCAGALAVGALFQVAGVVEQDRQQGKLKRPRRELRLRPGGVPPLKQPRQAESPLQRMLKVVVTGVHRLVILVVAAEALDRPGEGRRHH